jgi:hypothetical protein
MSTGASSVRGWVAIAAFFASSLLAQDGGAVKKVAFPPLKSFAPKDGGFKIDMPGKPEAKVPKEPDGLHSWTAKPEPGLILMVTRSQLKEDLSDEELKAQVEGARDSAVGQDGKLDKDDEITVGKGKFPGREFRFTKETDRGTTHYRIRACVVGTRLYQAVAVANVPEKLDTPPIERFFKSFEPSKPKAT